MAIAAGGAGGECVQVQEQQRRDRALRVGGAALAAHGGEPAWSGLALCGDEAVDTLFDYRLLVRQHVGVPAAAPRALLGLGLDVRIELAPRGQAPRARWIHGLVSQAALMHSDERGAVFALRLRPWPWRARLRGSCRAWRDRTVPQVLCELLAPLGATVVQRLRGNYPPRDYLVQFNESDWECFARLAAEWGIHFWFEHRRGGLDLVLADHNDACLEQPAAAWSELGVARPGERDDHECLHGLRHGHALGSAGWCARDDDYTLAEPVSEHDAWDAQAPHGEASGGLRLQRFAWRGDGGIGAAQPRQTGESRHDDARAVGHALARARLQALRQPIGRAHGHGPVRGLAVGHRVRLRGHRLAALNTDWLVVAARVQLREHGVGDVPWPLRADADAEADADADADAGRAGAAQAFGDAGRGWDFPQSQGVPIDGWQLHTEVVLQRADRPLRPVPREPRRRVGGVHAARVAHAHEHPGLIGTVRTDDLGRVRVRLPWDRAPGDAATTPAMRVAMPWAGCAMGRLHLPRLGEELLVAYVDGDLERPVGLGALHDVGRRPAWDLPANRALTGVIGREWPSRDGDTPSRGSFVVFDDTPRAQQAQFGCDHLHGLLSLGRVVRVTRGSGRGCGREAVRGDGVELRTDGHGLVHSGRELLLSSSGRAARAGAAADASQLLRMLRRALRWHAAWSRADAASLPDGAGARDLLLEGAKGFALASDTRAHAVAGAHVALGAGRQLGLRAGSDLLATAAQGLRVFVHRLGLRLLAASGPLHVHACAGSLDASAGHAVRLSSGGELLVHARRGVLLQGGASYLRLGPRGIEYGGPAFAVRSAGPRLRAAR